MVDSPANCLIHAATARTAAEDPQLLDNVRNKHLASAKAWEDLAATLSAKPARVGA